ncbi:hypothetical protein GOP47_0005486 [Adiantum capillus-veneris]|uniref:Uncharacterized protein n=1 Tax=Adiantum capillus-veneris TaxID=13818 RepID=A0A9D4V6U1_ADICA|nr:hypothetical protein GOP47_0005486 [Adiantum capillus-veneris]
MIEKDISIVVVKDMDAIEEQELANIVTDGFDGGGSTVEGVRLDVVDGGGGVPANIMCKLLHDQEKRVYDSKYN